MARVVGWSSMGRTCRNTDYAQGLAPETEQVQIARGSAPCLTLVDRPFSSGHPKFAEHGYLAHKKHPSPRTLR